MEKIFFDNHDSSTDEPLPFAACGVQGSALLLDCSDEELAQPLDFGPEEEEFARFIRWKRALEKFIGDSIVEERKAENLGVVLRAPRPFWLN